MADFNLIDLKIGLGVDPADASQDQFLGAQMRAALGWAGEFLGRPLDAARERRRWMPPPAEDAGLVIPRVWDYVAGSLAGWWWSADDYAANSAQADATGVIDTGDFEVEFDAGAHILSARATWPPDACQLLLVFREHLTPHPESIHPALILAVRNVIENRSSVGDQPTAVTQILAPWRRH